MERTDAVVLGAGIVGVSTALALQERGFCTVLVDCQQPGLGASFGNSGVIQREAVLPYAMPRDAKTLFRTILGKNMAARVHLSAIPGLLPFLTRYWWHSQPDRHRKIAKSYATLIEKCVESYEEIMADTNARRLLTQQGIVVGFRSKKWFSKAQTDTELEANTYGLSISHLQNVASIRQAIPHIRDGYEAAIHYHDPLTINDPCAMVMELFNKFKTLGGRFEIADAMSLTRSAGRFELKDAANHLVVDAKHAVNALGAHAALLARKFGLAVPMGLKRGYHLHFAQVPGVELTTTFADAAYGFVLTPKAAGIRLTTGAEFAKIDAHPTPRQLEQIIPIAKKIYPLGDQLEDRPWMGIRPCMPDMLPVIGQTPTEKNLWCAFGHGHQGLTLGPITGQLIAEMITGENPAIDMAPFSPARFLR
ncbi:MAG: FAD-binding oxidoreductase [Hyphomicrobiales bacterium]